MYKHFILIVAFIAGITFYSDAQKAIFTKASVISANVYSNGAELQNAVSTSLPKGNSTLIITNISESIQEKSIQILSSNNITILSSKYTNNIDTSYLLPVTDSKLKIINDSITKLKTQLTKTSIELDAYKMSIELLDKNQTLLSGSSTATITQLNQLTEYYTNKRIDLSTKVINFETKKTTLEENIALLQSSLNRQSQTLEKQSNGCIILQLNNSSTGNTNMEISYLADNAYWQPFYEIKGDNIKSPLNIILKGKIIQTTGLDWSNVKLTLINGLPTRNSIAPTLNPWYLFNSGNRLGEVVVTALGLQKKSDITGAINTIERNNLEDAKLANFNTNTNQLNTSYNIDIPYSIPTGKDGMMVQLQKNTIPVQYTYYTVPRFSTNAFLIAKIKDFNSLDLLDAPANIVFENMYIGETRIVPNESNNEMQITLGEDKRVSIKKERILEKSGEKFLSSNKEKTVTYDIIVKNNKKEAIDIEIKDQLPVSNDNAIKIEILENSSAEYDAEKGFLTWKPTIAPSETKKYRISYKVRYPKDYNLQGL